VAEPGTRDDDPPIPVVEQRVQDGTAGAIGLAQPYVDGPVLIIFVDTLFDADLTLVNRADADGIIWAKEVEDYQRFGVVVTDEDGYMTRIVEKPSEPKTNLAVIGVYMYDARVFEVIMKLEPSDRGELEITDVNNWYIRDGSMTYEVLEGWWTDAGTFESLLRAASMVADGGANHGEGA